MHRSRLVIIFLVMLILSVIGGLIVAQDDDSLPSRITYTSDRHIHSMQSDGSDQQLLIDTPSWVGQWSPDGDWILIMSGIELDSSEYNESEYNHLYRWYADGSEMQRITDEPISHLGLISLSPDGEWIAYTSCPDGFMHDCQLYSMRSDGTQHTRITTGYAQHPSWSPDSEWIVFDSYTGSERHVYVVRPDNSDLNLLTGSLGGGSRASWSPNGEWITFLYEYDLYQMRSDGSDIMRLTTDIQHEWFDQAVWSPDSEWIVFVARSISESGETENFSILYRIRVDGSELEPLTQVRSSRAEFSPDGEWIVFTCSYDNRLNSICRMRADGSDLIRLTDDSVSAGNPHWWTLNESESGE